MDFGGWQVTLREQHPEVLRSTPGQVIQRRLDVLLVGEASGCPLLGVRDVGPAVRFPAHGGLVVAGACGC